MPKVSVIVTVYNVENYLPRCLDSLSAQTLEDIELLLVDDGSTDQSGRICDMYAKSHPNARVIHKENGGVSSARNAGLDAATGEFIGFVTRIVERAVVAAKREGVIQESHLEEGCLAGAAHDALSQIVNKAIGLNIGGKIGIARSEDHIVVSIFFGIGLLHLNEVAIAIGHRAI